MAFMRLVQPVVQPLKRTGRLLGIQYIQKAQYFTKHLMGNRDVVGFGASGMRVYVDTPGAPFPAIRWKENSQEIHALREKERGDWRALSCEEKHALYRASFCLSFSEMRARNPGQWKIVLAGVVFLLNLSFLFNLWIDRYVLVRNPMSTPTLDSQLRAAHRLITENEGQVSGISAHWDYENMKWKNGKPYRPYKDLPVEEYMQHYKYKKP